MSTVTLILMWPGRQFKKKGTGLLNTLNVTSHLRNGPPGASGCLSNVVPNQIDLVIWFGTSQVWIVTARATRQKDCHKYGANNKCERKGKKKKKKSITSCLHIVSVIYDAVVFVTCDLSPATELTHPRGRPLCFQEREEHGSGLFLWRFFPKFKIHCV